MKGTGALPLGGRITVVSTGDLARFPQEEGANVQLSRSAIRHFASDKRDDDIKGRSLIRSRSS